MAEMLFWPPPGVGAGPGKFGHELVFRGEKFGGLIRGGRLTGGGSVEMPSWGVSLRLGPEVMSDVSCRRDLTYLNRASSFSSSSIVREEARRLLALLLEPFLEEDIVHECKRKAGTCNDERASRRGTSKAYTLYIVKEGAEIDDMNGGQQSWYATVVGLSEGRIVYLGYKKTGEGLGVVR